MNMHKSKAAAYDLINETSSSSLHLAYDILCLQEPWQDAYNNVRHGNRWHLLYPTSRLSIKSPTRSVLLINKALTTNQWQQFDIPGTNDVTAIQIIGTFGRLTVINIYNDGNHDLTLELLRTHLEATRPNHCAHDNDYVVWAGDFNRHHALWEPPENTQLLTTFHQKKAQPLIDLITDFDMEAALPPGTPTFRSATSGNWTRPDNVFVSQNTQPLVVACGTCPHLKGPEADHLPIETIIDINLLPTQDKTTRNFRATDWEKFEKSFAPRLRQIGPPRPITNTEELNKAVSDLTTAIQETIEAEVPTVEHSQHIKRWWTADLTRMKKTQNRLSALAHKFRTDNTHPVHQQLKTHEKAYASAIQAAKREHWESFLDTVTQDNIYQASNYATADWSETNPTTLPSLTVEEGNTTRTVTSNEDKAEVLCQTFFPERPALRIPSTVKPIHEPVDHPLLITEQRIYQRLTSLSPYKAPGPDGIPNVVLKENAHLITPYLLEIFRAICTLKVYPTTWHLFITVVLRKPGRPSYRVASSYRPIALYCTMAKVLSGLIAEDITFFTEKFHLIPNTQFGGRPGRMTTDHIHLLVNRIQHAWRNKRVVSVLSLDIDSAFPNAVPERLFYNMRRRGVPEEYVQFTACLLNGRRTQLRFGDFTSETFNVTNGIGQGDPISMILFLYYNADFLDIPLTPKQRQPTFSFVDDMSVCAEANTLAESTALLQTFMEKRKGGFSWSRHHNSTFTPFKQSIMHFSRRTILDPHRQGKLIPEPHPTLFLQGEAIREEPHTKILGIYVDNKLNWHRQRTNAVANASSIVMAYHRLTRVARGIPMKLMRRLYLTVVMPKLTYGISVWYIPPHLNSQTQSHKRMGSVTALKQLTSIQRKALLTTAGALRTTPTDLLEAQLNLLPMDLYLERKCHDALTRIYTLPETHPLHNIARTSYNRRNIKRYPAPLHLLPRVLLPVPPHRMEIIKPPQRSPNHLCSFTSLIPHNKEQAAEQHHGSESDFSIYTDGSRYNGGVGAAAILMRHGTVTRKLRAYLGSSNDLSAFDAEGAGLILGFHLIRTSSVITRRSHVSLYLDGKSAQQATQKRTTKTGQHLTNYIHSTAERAGRLPENTVVQWIPGHAGIRGNEIVDNEAKRAANGEHSRLTRLPSHLRQPLPVSISSARQQWNTLANERWSTRLTASPRHSRIFTTTTSKSIPGIYKRLSNLPRQTSSAIIHLRSRHIPLNEYLHRFKRADSPDCAHCALRGISSPESVKHLLIECPTYRKARFRLRTALGRHADSLAYLTSKKTGITALTQFINETRRLHSKYGELLIDLNNE